MAIPALEQRADDNLRYIRSTMERAGAFTAVPGWGGVAVGVTAICAAWLASLQPTPARWLAVWLAEGALAVIVLGWSLHQKARAAKSPLWTGPARRFALAFLPPIAVGALLTFALFNAGAHSLLPAVWLLLYGTGVITGGAHSVPVVPVMGLAFVALGTVTLFTPSPWSNLGLAAGFGILHVIFGAIIARKYGG